jgi:TonB family protein
VRSEAGDADSLIFGKPLAAYADQYLFNAATEARLAELRARAAAQSGSGSAAGLAQTLGQARAALELETFRLATLYAQESLSSGVAEHEAALEAFMEKSTAAERQQARARIDPLLEQARRGVDELMQIPTLAGLQQAVERESTGALTQAYNEERMRLAPFAAAWDREHGVTPMSRTRSKSCSPPHSQPSPTGKPQVDPAFASQPEYPPEARRLGFEGKVHVRAEISAKGCAERMEIARSSGVESLDAAALEWAEGLRFMPAQADGKPQATSYTFGVAFKLTE